MEAKEMREMHEISCALIWEALQPARDARHTGMRQAAADLILAHTGEDVTTFKDKEVDPASLSQLLTPRQSASIAVILRRLQAHGLSGRWRPTSVV